MRSFSIRGTWRSPKAWHRSMYCDRETTHIPKSQAGFIRNICLPLFEAWNAFLKSERIEFTCIEQLRINLQLWDQKSSVRRKTVYAEPPKKNPMPFVQTKKASVSTNCLKS